MFFTFFKAPSMVAKINIKKTLKSYIELTWDEIPLEQRNGIIESYKIFYWHEEGPVNGMLKAQCVRFTGI